MFNNSELRDCIEDGTIAFPAPDSLPGDDRPMPYFIVADDASSMRTWLMKPYSTRQLTLVESVFNYRLPRAWRIVENAFGILAHRFQCLLTTLTIESTHCDLHHPCLLLSPQAKALQNAYLDQ